MEENKIIETKKIEFKNGSTIEIIKYENEEPLEHGEGYSNWKDFD